MDRLRKGIFYIFKFDFQSSLKRRGWGWGGVDFYSKWHVYILGHVNKCRRALVNNPIKASFYGKRKKKQLML